FMSLRKRQSRSLAAPLVLLVVFQATLGMWTVTMLLKPAIVTAHLLGGMAMLALLAWLALQQFDFAGDPRTRAVRFPAFAGLVAVAGWAALKASRIAALRPLAALIGILLLLQFSLGVANVALGLPLSLAAAHNAGAALLLVSLVVLHFFSFRGLRPFR